MGFIENTRKAFTTMLGSSSRTGSEDPARGSTTKQNPILESLDGLNSYYKVGQTAVGDFVRFGAYNDIPEILTKLKDQSPTHSGIVLKKSKMVAGNDTEVYVGDKSAEDITELKVLLRHFGGEGVSFRDVWVRACYQWELHGAIALHITRKGNKIRKVKVLEPNSYRLGTPDDNGKVGYFIVRRTWKATYLGSQDNAAKKVYAYDPKKSHRESIMYVRNPRSSNPLYGVPDYLSAYYFINADFEFGKHIQNSAEHGFSPRVIGIMTGRNMTKEQKQEEYDYFKKNFTGGDGDKFMLSWVKKMEEAPVFKSLDIQNLDRTIDVLARLNDSKILTAHNVTSPTLFGIMVSGKLGGTGDELKSAYHIFRATETLPNRRDSLVLR
jgi:hypothetical protein